MSPQLTGAVLFSPQIIRVQSPDGVKRITATKRETVATFLKKVAEPGTCFAQLWKSAFIDRAETRSLVVTPEG